MIIKKARITSFGSIKNKEIDFEKGINLVYGENEKGKSTIQNFIRSWLFGFSNTRGGKNSLRKKYYPFNGEKMQGELVIEYDNRTYIIQRTFGQSKKEDTCNIIDELTGEEISWINKDEPGSDFLNVNSNTFSKTLYISQLGVSISKDKDEQIMDKIIDLFGCGEGEVSAPKALSKLKDSRKEIVTSRKSGKLDILRNRYTNVIEERYEAYKISEENLDNENKLLEEKERTKILRNEIDNLEIYKKYLKKIKLQKEYGEITNYLKRKELLKKEEETLDVELKKQNGKIDEEFIAELSKNNDKYLSLLDVKNEEEHQLNALEVEIKNEKEELSKYDVFASMDDGLKEKLLKLSIEQENLKEKIIEKEKIRNSIQVEQDRLNQKKRFLGDIVKLKEHKDDIKELFKEYENKLRSVKEEAEKGSYFEEVKSEKESLEKRNLLSKIGIIISLLLSVINFSMLKNSILIYLISLIIMAISVYININYRNSIKVTNEKLKEKNLVEELNKEIQEIEEELSKYVDNIKCKNYENLLRAINSLENYLALEERTLLVIEERSLRINIEELAREKEKYNQNQRMLESLLRLSESDTLEEMYKKIDEYYLIKKRMDTLSIKYKAKKESVERISYELDDKEMEIKNKLIFMDLDYVDLVDLNIYLREFKEKINKKKELEKELGNVEETYKVLLKDRDIASIEDDLKDLMTKDINYTYNTEEEIDNEVKDKSMKLIESEKKIKDLENEIKISFLGRRDINAIEEDLNSIIDEIKVLELRLAAIDMAIETLEESERDIRGSFGPELNKKILENFKKITGDKYSEVKLRDDYEMMVRDENNIFNGEYLSNGANDQLYLALRIAFIDIIYKDKEVVVLLDDAFIQYDDNRREKALKLIEEKEFNQVIMFTCQGIEENIMKKKNMKFNYINI